MKKRYFMGIDIAKATFDFCLLSGHGAVLWRGRFSNDASGIKQFLAQLAAGRWKPSLIHFALESSGVYGKALIAALHQGGLAVSVLNPAQVKFFAFSVLRRTKKIGSMPKSLPAFVWNENPWLLDPCAQLKNNSTS